MVHYSHDSWPAWSQSSQINSIIAHTVLSMGTCTWRLHNINCEHFLKAFAQLNLHTLHKTWKKKLHSFPLRPQWHNSPTISMLNNENWSIAMYYLTLILFNQELQFYVCRIMLNGHPSFFYLGLIGVGPFTCILLPSGALMWHCT